jgi:hypothetical protein
MVQDWSEVKGPTAVAVRSARAGGGTPRPAILCDVIALENDQDRATEGIDWPSSTTDPPDIAAVMATKNKESRASFTVENSGWLSVV